MSFSTSTRVLSGTPSATQSAATYTYKVRDKNGDEATDEFTIAVTNSTPTLSSVADQSWLKDIEVALTLPAASGGDTPLTYSLGGSLPNGMSFSTSTRVLSGTPSGTQSAATYTYKVRDKNGDEATDEFTIAVTNSTPTLSSIADQNWAKDVAVSLTLPAATGGDAPLTYSLGGSLPTGVSFTAATRVLAGTPSALKSATTYTYKVEDANGDEASDKFTIAVVADTDPTLSSVADQSWLKDIEVALTLPAASGGNSPLTYSLSGSPPAGMSFSASTRVLSGTPSATQSAATHTFKVRDSDGDEATEVFTITVTNSTPTLSSIADQSWLKDIEVALTLPAATGGDSPLTYSLGGSPPTGMSFSTSTRVLSGTPSATQSAATYTFKVRDKNGDEATEKFTIAVTNATPTLSSVDDQSWLKDIQVALTLPAATGGDDPLTYSLGGSPPTGMSFDTSTRVLSGTPSATQSAATYTFKVRDKNGDEATEKFTIAVTNSTPTLSSVANQRWVRDVMVSSLTLPTASGGDAPLTYSLGGNLPTGISYDTSSRVLSGTPSAAQSAATYTYKVRDKNHDEVIRKFTITVTDTTPSLPSVANLNWAPGIPVSVTLPTPSGGDAPLTYSLSGALPTGVSFNATTRVLAGTPSVEQPATNYVYQVRDRHGDSDSTSFTITVAPQSQGSDDTDDEPVRSDPRESVPSDSSPIGEATVEGVPVLQAGPSLTSGDGELRVRLPAAPATKEPVLAWNYRLDAYGSEIQIGTWDRVPDVWHMERAVQIAVKDTHAVSAASGPAAAGPETSSQDLPSSPPLVPVARGIEASDAPTTPAAESPSEELLFSQLEVPVVRGSAASYTVRLATQPTSTVTVTVAGPTESDGGLTVTPAQLTFSDSDWNQAQVLTVWAAESEGEYRRATFAHAASGGGYEGVTGDVTAMESVSATKALTVSVASLEIGENDTVSYTVHLASRPSSDVSLWIRRSGNADLSVDADPLAEGNQTSLTFTPADWNIARTISVLAGQDENGLNETAFLDHELSGDGFGQRIGDLKNTWVYVLSLQAVNRLGASAFSTAVRATPMASTLAAPANLRALPGPGEITLTWSDPEDDTVTGYQYRYSTYSGPGESRGQSAWKRIDPTTHHVVKGARFGVRYTLEVRALQGGQRGAISRATAIPALAPKVSRVPAGFVADWTGSGEVQLRWDAETATPGYESRYSGDDGGTWTEWQPAAMSCDETSCNSTVTVEGNPDAYEFELRRTGSEENIARARTGAHPDAPQAPILLSSTPDNPTEADRWELTWTGHTGGEMPTGWQYRSVYLEDRNGSTWTAWTDMQPATVEGVHSFTVMLEPRERKGQRMFQIRATNALGSSESSNVR